MSIYENELRNGKFVCSECHKCKKFVWPPSDFCNVCFSKVNWKQISGRWKLIEFSKKDNKVFCIAEFEKTIRIMGELETGTKIPIIGQDLDLVKCDYDKYEKFVFKLN